MPSHSLIEVIILGVVPLLLPHLCSAALLEPIQEHIIVDLVQLLLEDVLALVNVAAETNLYEAIESLDLDLGVFVAELRRYFSQN